MLWKQISIRWGNASPWQKVPECVCCECGSPSRTTELLWWGGGHQSPTLFSTNDVCCRAVAVWIEAKSKQWLSKRLLVVFFFRLNALSHTHTHTHSLYSWIACHTCTHTHSCYLSISLFPQLLPPPNITPTISHTPYTLNLFSPPSLPPLHTHTHRHVRAHTHTRTHAHTHKVVPTTKSKETTKVDKFCFYIPKVDNSQCKSVAGKTSISWNVWNNKTELQDNAWHCFSPNQKLCL